MAVRLGIILVFDLDETLSGEYFDVEKNPARIPYLHVKLVNLILYARESKNVDAIFLLTNNGDKKFIELCVKGIGMYSKTKLSRPIFDYSMDANHVAVNGNGPRGNTANKTRKDVEYMLKKIGKSTEKLYDRCYFFDDNNTHTLCKECKYIQIDPPFKGVRGFTEIKDSVLEPVYEAIENGYEYNPYEEGLEMLGMLGGKRTRTLRRQTKRLRKSPGSRKKNRKHKY